MAVNGPRPSSLQRILALYGLPGGEAPELQSETGNTLNAVFDPSGFLGKKLMNQMNINPTMQSIMLPSAGGPTSWLGMLGFAQGGQVPGPGPTDTVPAMLTPGEFVVNKDAAQTFRALLEALNAQGMR